MRIWCKSSFLFYLHFPQAPFSFTSHHTLPARKVSENHQCHQISFLGPCNQAAFSTCISVITSCKDSHIFPHIIPSTSEQDSFYRLSSKPVGLRIAYKELPLASIFDLSDLKPLLGEPLTSFKCESAS